jgi:hypothetical protein
MVLGFQFRKSKARIQLHSERIENAFFTFPNLGTELDFGWSDEGICPEYAEVIRD